MPELTDKDRLRIADVAKTPEERASLEKVTNLFSGMIEERNAKLVTEFKAQLPNFDALMQDALRKHAESKLPEADPRRMAHDAYRMTIEGMRGNVPGLARCLDVHDKYPDIYGGASRAEVEAYLREMPRFSVRSTMTTSSSGMSYVLPVPTANEILGYADEYIPLNSIVRIWPVGLGNGIAGSIPIGTSSRTTCYITSQASAPTDGTAVPGTFTYSLLKFAVGLPFSNQLYDYSVPAFQAWVNHEAAYGLAIKQWDQFAVGTNSTQWMGLESASLTEVTNPTSDAADLIGALYLGVPQAHRPRSVWVCNEATLGKIWRLKDGNNARLVPFDTEKMTLFGKPIYTNSGMTDDLLFFGDGKMYVKATGRFMSAAIGFGNGYTMTSQDSTYIYIGEDCDGGVAMTNAWRYGTLS